jgi:hypothetical protein
MIQEYLNTYYNPDWVYANIKTYFNIGEFYRRDVINKAKIKFKSKWEDVLWSVIDYRLLSNLLYVRITKGKKIFANQPDNKKLDERGVRDNLCDYTKGKTQKNQLTLSGHVFAMALDFTVERETAEQTRNWIEEQDEKIPFKCRLEWKMKDKKTGVYIPITWVHMDTKFEPNNPHIYKFNI